MQESSKIFLKIMLNALAGGLLLLWLLSYGTGLFHRDLGGFASYEARREAPKYELINLAMAEKSAFMAGPEKNETGYTTSLNELIANGYKRNPSIVVFLVVIDLDLGTDRIQSFRAVANSVDGKRVYSYSQADGLRRMREAEPMKGIENWDCYGPDDFGGANFHAVLIKYPWRYSQKIK